MKKLMVIMVSLLIVSAAAAQTQKELEVISLLTPDKTLKVTLMDALSERQSTRAFSDKPVSLRHMSDLMWAAFGINRHDTGKRTAPSARNRMDVHVFVCLAEGNYKYDAKEHSLVPVSNVDCRPINAPMCIVLVTDTDDAMTGVDVGVISQNISLYCAAVKLATVPRAQMDKENISKALKLPEGQKPFLNHPVGYFK